MMLYSYLRNIFGIDLKQKHQEIDEIKRRNKDSLDKSVEDSTKRSKQAGRNFDKINVEMKSLADDIAVRIAKATRDLNTP